MIALLDRIAHKLTRRPKLVLLVAAVLLVLCAIGAAATGVNYDILTYLPPDLDSSQGEKLLEDPFHMAATTMLIVEGMPPEYSNDLCRRVEEVPGVSSALWISSAAGIQIPQDFLPEELREMFFSGDATMMIVQYDNPGASEETMEAIDQVRSLCNQRCFLAGFSVVIKDTKDLVDGELPLYVGLAVLLSLVVMCAAMESWLLPAAFLLSIGAAILYNFGTNIVLGEISYITQAIAAVLQLGVTMDYSIFLYHRYEEERLHYDDNRDAMAVAVKAAFTSLFSSSLTTVAGFLALCFMRLLLGRDIGLVMAKGVALGVATVVLVLPAALLTLDKPIRKYTHRVFLPDLSPVNRFVVRHNKAFSILALLLFIPALYGQNHAGVYYKLDEALPQDMPSIVATNKLKDEFNMASSHFIVMRDDLPYDQSLEMLEKLEAVEGVESVVAFDKFMSNSIPQFFIPQDILDICKRDGLQIAMINSRYETASDQAGLQVDELNAILKSYDPEAKMTGEAVLTKDLIDIADIDFKVTNYISIAAIFLIIAVTFRSISIPVLLVAAIELAICVNQGVPYFSGTVIPFVAPTVIGCVQLGATVDYAILMTTRFREELQKGQDRESAILAAAKASDSSIITSALVLFCATLGVGMISKIEIISSICLMLARGAFISALCILFLLPALLTAFEPLLSKTSMYWRKPKPAKAGKHSGSAAPSLSPLPQGKQSSKQEEIEKKGDPIR